MEFNCGEVPSDEWKTCDVTNEIWNSYWKTMFGKIKSYDYKNGEESGKIPLVIQKDDIDYHLIRSRCHGCVCDTPMCQAMFHKADKEDGGAMGALVYTTLPIYTSRESNKLKKNVPEDLCLVCLQK